MINVSPAISTPPPRRDAPAATAVSTSDFRDTLDGVSDAPAPKADVARLLVAAKRPTIAGEPAADVIPDPSIETDPKAIVRLVKSIAVDAATPADPAICTLPNLTGKRQKIAEDGNVLPADAADEDRPQDPVWSPPIFALLVQAPVVRPLFGGVAVSTGNVASIPVAASPAEAGAQLGEAHPESSASPDWAPAFAGEAAVGAAAGTAAGAAAGKAALSKDGIAVPIAQAIEPKPDLPVRIDTTAPAPQSSLPAQPVTLPAGQVFAAAIAAAVQARRDDSDAPETRTPLAIATAAIDAVHSPAITVTADAKQAALDLRQDSGLQGMIDHIEVLRDGADAGDTRIRLSPDALGGVDVSVRKDGDRVHVHFNADNQASARLLSDAQPRLAELAEARGVKLGQTSVETGGGNARQQPQPTQPILSTTPIAARDSAETTTDLRVA